jgi:iron complex outermembrane recepter protein
MKLLLSAFMLCIVVNSFAQKQFNDTSFLLPVEISSVKATEKNPFAKTNLNKATIKQNNIGQDLPFILNNTPNVVANSDAGNGAGYTGIRIRGTDATRINVTLNGIPYNDAESLGTFLVNIPDIASSAGSIQIQRGVGTSANGAGSFGGSINISTNELVKEKNLELNTTIGSYGLFKNTLLFNSGIFNKHFIVDARMSNIRSEGYVDRASAKLQSYFVSAAYVNDKNVLRLNVFTGREKTYQAYYGVLQDSLITNRTYNSAGTEKKDSPYENQVDDYTQTHYQLFWTRKFNPYVKANIATFLTRGKGFYEQYRANQELSNYGLPPFGSSTQTDMVNQLWLDNYFYGTTFSLVYDKKQTQLIFGGGYNRYEGGHYGKIIGATLQAAIPANYKWYNTTARKYDFSAYAKWTQTIGKNLQTFVDIQVRNIDYKINGFRNNPTLKVNTTNFFVNPKAGITYFNKGLQLYASYGQASKEPNRDDFEGNANTQPKAEKLHNIEMGVEYKKKKLHIGANFYHMKYKNQLVNTGKINDVGAYTRINIDDSYRAGVELFATEEISKYLSFTGNISFSENKVKNFIQYFDDYDNGGQQSKLYDETDIAYSPNVVGSFIVNITPIKNASIILTSKYVGSQFLDNTSNNNRKLNAFYTQDVRVGYNFSGNVFKEVNIYAQAINIFSKVYEPNGYTFSYISGGALTTENYFFPMAPANFVIGINISPNLSRKK